MEFPGYLAVSHTEVEWHSDDYEIKDKKQKPFNLYLVLKACTFIFESFCPEPFLIVSVFWKQQASF